MDSWGDMMSMLMEGRMKMCYDDKEGRNRVGGVGEGYGDRGERREQSRVDETDSLLI